MEEWEDKNGGGKRSKLVVVLDDMQFLDGRPEGATGGGSAPMRASGPAARTPAPAYDGGSSFNDEPEPMEHGSGSPTKEEEIPF